jgi:hypothetical protein
MMKSKASKSQDGPHKESHQHSSPHTVLWQLIMGFRTTQLIAVAARLNLPEHMKDGSQTLAYLSTQTKIDPRRLYRLIRALIGIGIIEANADNMFTVSSLGHLLCDNRPDSLRNLAILYGEEWLWKAYAQLDYSLDTGKSAFEHVHNKSLYDYLKKNKPARESFNNAMSAYSNHEAESIKEAYDFSEAHTIVDVGGGQGILISSILKAYNHLSGVVFDLPDAVNEVTREKHASDGDLKITHVSGDFFQAVAGGGDRYLLKSVLHNWDDPSCITILKNCRKAMNDRARLLIIERVIPKGNETSEATLFDINMLVMTGGQERSVVEYTDLLKISGFILSRTIPTQSPLTILECSPA